MSIYQKFPLIVAVAFLLAAGSQAAILTNVESPPALESDHAQILGDLFGGSFVADGDGFVNGLGVTVERVDDQDDQIFDFDTWSAQAIASFAAASQSFGTQADGPLFALTGAENSVSGSVDDVAASAQGVVFGRFGSERNTADVFTDPTLNADGQDHVVTYTYSINGDPVADTYLLFFEDRPASAPQGSDFDYNDLVVRVIGQTTTAIAPQIPEPSTMVLIGLGSLAMFGRRR